MLKNLCPDAPYDLSFDRTVSRTLVHRRANAEVFLTDYRPVDSETFMCAAQLPRYHAYYDEGLAQAAAYDVLLLLECCRQAATYGGHARFDNPSDTTNLVKEITVSITDPDGLVHTHQPGELLMRVSVPDAQIKGARSPAPWWWTCS